MLIRVTIILKPMIFLLKLLNKCKNSLKLIKKWSWKNYLYMSNRRDENKISSFKEVKELYDIYKNIMQFLTNDKYK